MPSETSSDESNDEKFVSACEEQLSVSASGPDQNDDEDFIVMPKDVRDREEMGENSGLISPPDVSKSPGDNLKECDSTSKDQQVCQIGVGPNMAVSNIGDPE
jgi:hypothetical protein